MFDMENTTQKIAYERFKALPDGKKADLLNRLEMSAEALRVALLYRRLSPDRCKTVERFGLATVQELRPGDWQEIWD